MGDMIFISYRRQDAEADAGRLHADLVREFGPDRVFKDVDDIPIGGSVADRISAAVASSSVVLVLIGPDWSPERLTDPEDWVRIEIISAMEQGVSIVPVLLRRARMPRRSQLPDDLRRLADLNAADIEHSSWQRDLEPLLDAIRVHVQLGSGTDERLDRSGDAHAVVPTRGWKGGRSVLVVGLLVAAGIGAAAVVVIARGGPSNPIASTTSSPSPGSTAISTASLSGDSVESSATAATTADPGSMSPEVIAVTVDGSFVDVEPPATLGDDGVVDFPQAGAGSLRVTFTPSVDDEYVLWARVRIPADVVDPADSNSLFIVEGAHLSRSDEFIWDFWEGRTFPKPGVWEWDRVSTRGATGSEVVHERNPFTVIGRRGIETVVTIGGREPGVALDRLYLTDDPDWQPPGCELSTACSTRRVGASDVGAD